MPRLTSGRICPGPSRGIAENRAEPFADLSHRPVLNCRAQAARPWGHTFLQNISCQVLQPGKGHGVPVVTIIFSIRRPAGQSCLQVHVKEICFFFIYCSLTGMQNAAVGSGVAWPRGWLGCSAEGGCATQPLSWHCQKGRSCPPACRGLAVFALPKATLAHAEMLQFVPWG